MSESEGNVGLFDHIIGDMKLMGPLWDDLLLKASKFYSVVRQTALSGDIFLDSFQKIADAITNSKGATRDIGVSFTKIVMRHRAVENKLKVFVAILNDNFIIPLQDSLDEWKKSCNQLEKEHSKDYKRLKSELKKSVTETCKLKKKITKKMGSKEYGEQFRESVKLSTTLQKSLEEQEKAYLRKVMVEERTRVTQFFHYYKPCMEQQLSLVADIEQLQSILDETVMQCESPFLPSIYEEVVNEFKVPNYLSFNTRKDSKEQPESPFESRMRYGSVSCPPTQAKIPLRRSLTSSSFNRNGADSVPVSILSSPLCGTDRVSCDNDSRVSSSSFSSSSSSLDQGSQPTYDTVSPDEFPIDTSSFDTSAANKSYAGRQVSSNPNVTQSLKTHTSWSSIGASDSSGIGSYNSLTSHNRSAIIGGIQYRNCSASESDPIETDIVSSEYQNIDMLRYSTSSGFHSNSDSNGGTLNQGKYATIDRSHFRRNKAQISALVENKSKPLSNSSETGESSCPPSSQKADMKVKKDKVNDDLYLNVQALRKGDVKSPLFNKYATIDRSHIQKNQKQLAATLKELQLKNKLSDNSSNDEDFPDFPDYKMNLPKSRSSIERQYAGKKSIFQLFEGQNESLKCNIQAKSPFELRDKVTYDPEELVFQPREERYPMVVRDAFSNHQYENQFRTPLDHSSPQHSVHKGTPFQIPLQVEKNVQKKTAAETLLPKPKPTPHLYGIQRNHSCASSNNLATEGNKCDEPEPAKPGTFEAALQERRNSVLKKTFQ